MCFIDLELLNYVLFVFQVQYILGMCTCPTQFPMVKVSEGKYKVGDSKTLIFMRVSTVCIVDLGFVYARSLQTTEYASYPPRCEISSSLLKLN